MTNIRIGIVGFGSWTRKAYLPALLRDGRADIISVAAPSKETHRQINTQFGTNINIYRDINEILNGPEIDAIMIAVPDNLHEKTLLIALESNIAVFYEPPITDTRTRIAP